MALVERVLTGNVSHTALPAPEQPLPPPPLDLPLPPSLEANVDRLEAEAVHGRPEIAAARYHAVSGATLERPTAPFSGVVDGEAPVTNVVSVLDTLADLLEASAPGA